MSLRQKDSKLKQDMIKYRITEKQLADAIGEAPGTIHFWQRKDYYPQKVKDYFKYNT